MERDYDTWNKQKKILSKRKNPPDFNLRDIWWCHLGTNIGDEENGKGEQSLRPILVYKKFNRRIFLGIPLSSKVKYGQHHHILSFHNKEQTALITQIKLIDQKRLLKKMGRLSEQQYQGLKEKITEMLS